MCAQTQIAEEKKEGLSPLSRRHRGKALHTEEKRMVFNLFKEYSDKRDCSRTQNVKATASSLGMSETTVWKVIKEV